MMLEYLLHSQPQGIEQWPVSGEYVINLEALQFLEGRYIVAQGVVAGEGIVANVGGGFKQDVVTSENELLLFFVKADMTWRVSRRPNHLKAKRVVGDYARRPPA